MAKVLDPVTGEEVDTEEVNRAVSATASGAGQSDPDKGTKYFYNGQWYYFASLDSRVRFMAEPDKYA